MVMRHALEFNDTEMPRKWALFSDSKPTLHSVQWILKRESHKEQTHVINIATTPDKMATALVFIGCLYSLLNQWQRFRR